MIADDAIQNLKHAFESGRLAHSYIIVGSPRDEGRTVAEKVLGLIFCTGQKKPCGECKSCQEIGSHKHPDVLWVEPQKKSRKISIEQIRDLQKQVFQTSFFGGWKALVLVGADRMGDQAANAFLKTLEEPPRRCIFLLLTDSPQFLLPTVVSRCQAINVSSGRLDLPGEWRQRVVEILSDGFGSPQGKRSVTAAFACAESLLEFLSGIKKAIEKEETEIAAESDAEEDEETLDARVSSRYREARASIMRSILLWHRDVLMLVCGMDRGLVFGDDGIDCLKSRARNLSLRSALGNVRIVEDMNRQFDRNLSENVVLNLGFSRLL